MPLSIPFTWFYNYLVRTRDVLMISPDHPDWAYTFFTLLGSVFYLAIGLLIGFWTDRGQAARR